MAEVADPGRLTGAAAEPVRGDRAARSVTPLLDMSNELSTFHLLKWLQIRCFRVVRQNGDVWLGENGRYVNLRMSRSLLWVASL
mmetsp:Transcript_4591/g.8302  ORF Transcript_4591/g.8302 Transcript_4591/m.8302 type:complete len:84 (-) Transcript_4591:165-416(-)